MAMAEDERSSRMKLFVSELTKRVECPVCLSVPTKAPIFMCPHGHNICCECKTQCQFCPVCREPMGNTKNLLAFTVIELMDHVCPYHGCSTKMPLTNLETHKMTCEYEPVECPADFCFVTVARNDIVKHLIEDCCDGTTYDVSTTNNVVRIVCQLYYTGVKAIFDWDGKFFILSVNQSSDGTGKDLFMFMAGSNEDLSQYEMEISVENRRRDQFKRGKISYTYSGRPNSLHMSFRKSRGGLFLTQEALGHLGYDVSTNSLNVDLVIQFKKSA